MNDEQLLYRLALTFLPGVGNVTARRLAVYCGGAEAVFRETRQALRKIPGVGSSIVAALRSRQAMQRAAQELEFIRAQQIAACFFMDQDYPSRLREVDDAPALLYYKGRAALNAVRILAIVGSRRATAYGREQTEKLVQELAGTEVLILSGLAYGIDIAAHRAAMNAGLPTIGVTGHGLDRIYPPAHADAARQMMEQGGILTEFPSGTKPEAGNFPQRNRVIAGMADAVVVMEAGDKGGALITARIAASYNRDVFAYPGRSTDPASTGCNRLIKQNVAALVENATDILKNMQWDLSAQVQLTVTPLLPDLSPDELDIVTLLQQRGRAHLDEICVEKEMNAGKASGLLLNLEFAGLVKTLPGKIYQLAL